MRHTRTPFRTELWWLFAVLLYGGLLGALGTGWVLWYVFAAGAGC